MMKEWLKISLAIVTLNVLIVLAVVTYPEAQTPLTWKMKACGTLDCVTATLNSLPIERALEAKVIVINSTRSFLGVWSDPYYIYHR